MSYVDTRHHRVSATRSHRLRQGVLRCMLLTPHSINADHDDIDGNNYDDIGENCDDDGGGLRSWVADL